MKKIWNGNHYYQCLLCLTKLGSKKIFAQHLRAKHSSPDCLECSFCAAKLNDKQALLDHMTSNHKNEVKKRKKLTPKKYCDSCQEMIGTSRFSQHKINCQLYFKYWKQDVYGFQCLLCTTRLKRTKIEVENHIRRNHPKLFETQYCSTEKSTQQELLNHENVNFSQEPMKRMKENRLALENPDQDENEKDPNPNQDNNSNEFSSLGCKISLASNGDGTYRVQKTSEKPEKTFTEDNLNSPEKTFNENSSKTKKTKRNRKKDAWSHPVDCPICGKKITERRNLKKHILQNHNINKSQEPAIRKESSLVFKSNEGNPDEENIEKYPNSNNDKISDVSSLHSTIDLGICKVETTTEQNIRNFSETEKEQNVISPVRNFVAKTSQVDMNSKEITDEYMNNQENPDLVGNEKSKILKKDNNLVDKFSQNRNTKYPSNYNGECKIKMEKVNRSNDDLVTYFDPNLSLEENHNLLNILTNPSEKRKKQSRKLQESIPTNDLDQNNTQSYKIKPFLCEYCKKAFTIEDNLKRHNKYGHQNLKIKGIQSIIKLSVQECKHCKEVVNKNDWNKHYEICLEASKYMDEKTCLVCDNEFDSTIQGVKHIRMEHSNVIGISQENSKENSQGNSKEEINLSDDENDSKISRNQPNELTVIFTCPICSKNYGSIPDIETHISAFHRIPRKVQRQYMKDGNKLGIIIGNSLQIQNT